MSDPIRDARADLRSSLYGGELKLDALYNTLAVRVRDAVERYAERKDGKRIITPVARKRIMRDVTAALQDMYPSRRGAPSVLEELIVAACAQVSAKPVARAVAEIEAADQEVGAVLRRRAQDETVG